MLQLNLQNLQNKGQVNLRNLGKWPKLVYKLHK